MSDKKLDDCIVIYINKITEEERKVLIDTIALFAKSYNISGLNINTNNEKLFKYIENKYLKVEEND